MVGAFGHWAHDFFVKRGCDSHECGLGDFGALFSFAD